MRRERSLPQGGIGRLLRRMPARGSQFNQARAKRLSIEGRLAGGPFRDCLLRRNFQQAAVNAGDPMCDLSDMSQAWSSGSTTMASSAIRRKATAITSIGLLLRPSFLPTKSTIQSSRRSKIAPRLGLLPSIEVLEGKRQHRPLIGVRKLQRLTLDLARKFVAQHTAAEWREEPAMIVELREDFSKLRPPGSVSRRGSRQAKEPAMIESIQLNHARDLISYQGSSEHQI